MRKLSQPYLMNSHFNGSLISKMIVIQRGKKVLVIREIVIQKIDKQHAYH